MTSKTNNFVDLINIIEEEKNDFVVVCGYDNVGKGRLLSLFHDLGYRVFHPDYSLICDQVSQSGRWSYFMYFLDIYNSVKEDIYLEKSLVFDRSALCGAIYNDDPEIAKEYAKRISNISVLHVLVTCDKDSYNEFIKVRGNESKPSYDDYLVYTERYRSYMKMLGLNFIEFVNVYDKDIGDVLSKTCAGCSHFRDVHCILKNIDRKPDDLRCEESIVKEVQDI